MNAQLVVPKELAYVNIKHIHLPLGYEIIREAVAGGLSGGYKIGCTRETLVELRPTLFKYENKNDMNLYY